MRNILYNTWLFDLLVQLLDENRGRQSGRFLEDGRKLIGRRKTGFFCQSSKFVFAIHWLIQQFVNDVFDPQIIDVVVKIHSFVVVDTVRKIFRIGFTISRQNGKRHAVFGKQSRLLKLQQLSQNPRFDLR